MCKPPTPTLDIQTLDEGILDAPKHTDQTPDTRRYVWG